MLNVILHIRAIFQIPICIEQKATVEAFRHLDVRIPFAAHDIQAIQMERDRLEFGKPMQNVAGEFGVFFA